jgi:hypothetical protein
MSSRKAATNDNKQPNKASSLFHNETSYQQKAHKSKEATRRAPHHEEETALLINPQPR